MEPWSFFIQKYSSVSDWLKPPAYYSQPASADQIQNLDVSYYLALLLLISKNITTDELLSLLSMFQKKITQ